MIEDVTSIGIGEYNHLDNNYIKKRGSNFYQVWTEGIGRWAKEIQEAAQLNKQQEFANQMTYLLQQIKIRLNNLRQKSGQSGVPQISTDVTTPEGFTNKVANLIESMNYEALTQLYFSLMGKITGKGQPFLEKHSKKAVKGSEADDQTEAALVALLRTTFDTIDFEGQGITGTSVSLSGKHKVVPKIMEQLNATIDNRVRATFDRIEGAASSISGFKATKAKKATPKEQKVDVEMTISYNGQEEQQTEQLMSQVASGMAGKKVSATFSIKNYSANKYFTDAAFKNFVPNVGKYYAQGGKGPLFMNHSLEHTTIKFSGNKNNSANGIIVPASQVKEIQGETEYDGFSMPDSISFYLIGYGRLNSWANRRQKVFTVANSNPGKSVIEQTWNKLRTLYEVAGYGQSLIADYVLINDPVSTGIWVIPSMSVINAITNNLNNETFNFMAPSITMSEASSLVT